MKQELPTIRLLDSVLINQIAAGEVVERPLNVVKELVENALDANASFITITLEEGGKTLIEVADDGYGIAKDQLKLALLRHATSKIPDNDLFNIQSFGFRGEALPSIASVSKLTIESRPKNQDIGYAVSVESGIFTQNEEPVNCAYGTKISVKDLFFSTPVRLKFLKSTSTELGYINDIIEKIAFANPYVGFKLIADKKILLDLKPAQKADQVETIEDEWKAYSKRLLDVCKEKVMNNVKPVFAKREGISLKGVMSLPTYHQAKTSDQHFFVNNRPVRDKILINALKAAYRDVLEHNINPFVVLFLEIDPFMVDLNAHPNKTEVRFRDAQLVRNFVVHALQETLRQTATETAEILSQNAIAAFKPIIHHQQDLSRFQSKPASQSFGYTKQMAMFNDQKPYVYPSYGSLALDEHNTLNEDVFVKVEEPLDENDFPLGIAQCQLFDTYILSLKKDSFILVDQHAAHERLIYEKLKKNILERKIIRSKLLIPHVLTLKQSEVTLLRENKDILYQFGLLFDLFPTSVVMREIPELLEGKDVDQLLRDVLNDLMNDQDPITFLNHQTEKLATFACHNSIRAGRKLSIIEQNALLREMEETPFSGQCNHGRPTYIELSLHEIEKLFKRT